MCHIRIDHYIQVKGSKRNVCIQQTTLWVVVKFHVHSLPSAEHDVGQQDAQDDGEDQGHDHRHQVVWEEVSARGRLQGVELHAGLHDPRAHGGRRGSRLLLRQVKLQGRRRRRRR